jgi:hypothetical protein
VVLAVVEFQARYGGELADHLPMARVALHRMGAAPSRIAEFSQRYIETKKLQPLEDAPNEAAARATLLAQIQRDGRDVVLRRELRALMPGVGSGAFHPLIRLGYAIEAGDDREVAAAIVYWRDAFLDLDFRPDETAGSFRPEVAFDRLRSDLAGIELPPGILFARMAVAAADPRFAAAVRAAGTPRDLADLRALARFVVGWFALTRDFVALHAMTALHAFRLAVPYLDPSEALPPLWWALCAAYAGWKLSPIGEPAELEAASWESIFAVAGASDDEHVIKAAYSAWSEERAYGGELYRLAAARFVQLTD